MMIERSDCLEPIVCPVCGVTDAKILFPVTHNRSNVMEMLDINCSDTIVDIVVCRRCGHHYMTPIVKEALMSHYYSVLNSEFYHINRPVNNENRREYDDYTKIIKGLRESGKVLEIGCGNGFLLQRLSQEGYDCYGVEPSPMAYHHAKNVLHLNVENSFLTDSSFYHSKYDIVILIDVVEHITDMGTLMKQITSILKDGGVIFIGTGNIESMNARIAGRNWGYFLSWEHVSFFNKKSMRYLLEHNNFSDIYIRETSLQHRPFQNTIEFLKNLLKKIINSVKKVKYYHGITFDHFIVTAVYKQG